MAELIYTQPLFSILFSTISFLWDASTSLIFQGKAGPCPSSWLLLFFSWQTVLRVSIEEAGKDTTHSEFVKDLIYHQSHDKHKPFSQGAFYVCRQETHSVVFSSSCGFLQCYWILSRLLVTSYRNSTLKCNPKGALLENSYDC